MISVLPVCRGNRVILDDLITYWRESPRYRIVDSMARADVVWVKWANEQSILASQQTTKRNVVVHLCGSEFYHRYWMHWTDKVAHVVSMNATMSVPNVPTTFIPHWVDTDFWRPSDKQVQRRGIAVVGDFFYRKGQVGFVRMLADSSKRFDRVVMVGKWSTPELPVYASEAYGIRMQLANAAESAGINLELYDALPKEDIRTLLREVEFLASPSISEMHHRVVQEAMACGTPVVVANWIGAQGACPDMAVYRSPKDFWALVDDYPYDGDTLREYVLRWYTRDVILAKIDAVIEEVVNG